MSSSYQFSPLDEIIPPLYFSYILAFNPPDQEQFFRILQDGLLKLVEQYPILSGEIARDQSNSERNGHLALEIDTPPSQVPLAKRDLTLPGSEWIYSYEELKNARMPSSKLDARILAPLAAGVGVTRKVVSAQVNFIPGGMLLALCFSHAFVDARGASIILSLWASLCRSPQQDLSLRGELMHSENGENLICLQAKNLGANYEKLALQPDLWKLLGLDWRGAPVSQPGAPVFQLPLMIPAASTSSESSKINSIIFSFSVENLVELKQRATSTGSSDIESSWISTNDALVAFLWQHIMRARFPTSMTTSMTTSNGLELETEESIVTVAVDGRKGLLIPERYIGNVIFCSMSSLPIATVVAPETTLGNLAQSIRRRVNANKTAVSLTESLALASCIPANLLRSLRYAFADFVGRDLVTTSWVDLPFYALDWGRAAGNGGQIQFFRLPRGQFEGLCCMQPRMTDGTIEVVVGMGVEAMKRLMTDDEFLRYAQFVAE